MCTGFIFIGIIFNMVIDHSVCLQYSLLTTIVYDFRFSAGFPSLRPTINGLCTCLIYNWDFYNPIDVFRQAPRFYAPWTALSHDIERLSDLSNTQNQPDFHVSGRGHRPLHLWVIFMASSTSRTIKSGMDILLICLYMVQVSLLQINVDKIEKFREIVEKCIKITAKSTQYSHTMPGKIYESR